MKVLGVLLLLFATNVLARPPYETWDVYASIRVNTCQSANDVEDLCQQCAKFTKSHSVYPMCCTNTDEVRNWCSKAMSYGL